MDLYLSAGTRATQRSTAPSAALANVPDSGPLTRVAISPRLSATQVPLTCGWSMTSMPPSVMVLFPLSWEKSVPAVDPLSLRRAVVVVVESSVALPLTPRVPGLPVLAVLLPSRSAPLVAKLSAPTVAPGLATSLALFVIATPSLSVPLTEPGLPGPPMCSCRNRLR